MSIKSNPANSPKRRVAGTLKNFIPQKTPLVKFSGFACGERLAKYNRLLQIQNDLK